MYAVQCLQNKDINSENYMKTGGRHRKQKAQTGTNTKKPVLRIHGILGWIRIRICGSMPLANGSGSGSYYFRH
jgi:hypothetical protein